MQPNRNFKNIFKRINTLSPFEEKVKKYFIDRQVPNITLWAIIIAVWAIFRHPLGLSAIIPSLDSVTNLSFLGIAFCAVSIGILFITFIGKKPESLWLGRNFLEEGLSIVNNTSSAILMYGLVAFKPYWFLLGLFMHVFLFILYWRAHPFLEKP